MIKNDIVRFDNMMNTFSFKGFTEQDFNLFYFLCSQCKDKGTEEIIVDFDTIRELTGYTRTSNTQLMKDLDRMSDDLLKCMGKYKYDSKIVKFDMFPVFEIDEVERTLTVGVNTKFAYLINELANQFTQFELKQYISLNGAYSKKLYCLLKQWKTQGITPLYNVDEIKKLLSTPDYDARRLLDKIIKPAIEEISKKKAFQNLWVETKRSRRRGRPIEGFIFHFSKEDIEGQIYFSDQESYNEIADNINDKPKKSSKTRTSKAKPNRFHNFDQRNEDEEYFYKLEQKLLKRGRTDETKGEEKKDD